MGEGQTERRFVVAWRGNKATSLLVQRAEGTLRPDVPPWHDSFGLWRKTAARKVDSLVKSLCRSN